MLPTSIYVNPKFKSAHINPNFFTKKILQTNNNTKISKIHINPNFLQKPSSPHNQPQQQQLQQSQPQSTVDRAPIIKNTRRKLIRQSNNIIEKPKPIAVKTTISNNNFPKNNLMKIGKNKLIRVSSEVKRTAKLSELEKKQHSVQSKYKIVRSPSEQQRKLIQNLQIRKKFISNKYSLIRRVGLNETLTPKKIFITDKKLMRIGSSLHKIQHNPISSLQKNIKFRNKNLELLNINGVFYKSTTNKLQKSDIQQQPVTNFNNNILPKDLNTKKDTKRLLFVRGEKFALEANGKSLRRIDSQNSNNANNKIKRIDIGGLTYLPKSDSTYEMTESHKTRNYLSITKCKSINVLTRKFAKSNIPCAIFRRLGKCSAFARNRCPRVHDQKHVAICPKHLKGECNADKCLLSHDITLSKMPTCKFFLQGCCVKVDCPYLHKKLNDKVGICENFLKGFCSNADKCKKRHEFLCPSFDSIGKCIKVRCEYPHKTNSTTPSIKIITEETIKKEILSSNLIDTKKIDTIQIAQRYYINTDEQINIAKVCKENNDDDKTNLSDNLNDDTDDELPISLNVIKRPLLEILPSYIPL